MKQGVECQCNMSNIADFKYIEEYDLSSFVTS